MLCDKCKQRQANVYYRQEINGEVHEYHLCEECAAQSEMLNTNMSFDNLFEGFLTGMGQGGMLYGDGHLPHKGTDVCSSCGATFADFTNSGKLGCPDCYNTFRNRLRGALKSIQGGATKHTGKGSAEARRLKAQTAPKELTEEERLKTELDTAIKNEEYEKAAELRDKIRALKNSGKDGE